MHSEERVPCMSMPGVGRPCPQKYGVEKTLNIDVPLPQNALQLVCIWYCGMTLLIRVCNARDAVHAATTIRLRHDAHSTAYQRSLSAP